MKTTRLVDKTPIEYNTDGCVIDTSIAEGAESLPLINWANPNGFTI